MSVKTRTAEPIAEATAGKGEVAAFQPPRLPYHPAIQERFGVDRGGWKVLVEAIFPAAKTVDAIVLALTYCRERGLDPFKRVVHIVPMWDARKGEYVETIWPGIAELRTTAFRTKQYAGCDEAEFGPLIEQTFRGKVKRGGQWEDREVTVKFPEWCRITVYRELNGRVCKFVGPKVKWLEAYATLGGTELPNEMWQSRPEGQLEKCAEAAALRKAFPEEIGNELTAEEMAGRRLVETDELHRETPVRRPKEVIVPPAEGERKPLPPLVGEPQEVSPTPAPGKSAPPPEAEPDDLDIPPKLRRAPPQPMTPDVSQPEAFRAWLVRCLSEIDEIEALEAFWNDQVAPRLDQAFPPDRQHWRKLYADRYRILAGGEDG